MSVNIVYLLKAGPIAISLILITLAFRTLGVNLALVKSNNKEKLFCSIAYLPKETVQAVIGSIPLAIGVDAGGLILKVAALTIILTAPIGAIGIDLTYEKLLAPLKLRKEFYTEINFLYTNSSFYDINSNVNKLTVRKPCLA